MQFDVIHLFFFSKSLDIVEGNLKAIMRLVLALAAHYKPNSVRHSTQTNKQNIAGIAQVIHLIPLYIHFTLDNYK